MAETRPLTIALIGTRFMGRAHSNAWLAVQRFFPEVCKAVGGVRLKTVCGRDAKHAQNFASQWGWEHATTDMKCVIEDEDVDLIDIATPNHVHAEQSIAAMRAGKHVACEKPLAATLKQATAMTAAAAKARRCKSFVWFNYRRCPAIALAHDLVKTGKLGRLFHVRATYLQDWGGPETPLLWRFQSDQAGSGAHGDLNAHIIDMARFITGLEVIEIAGAIEKTFIEKRSLLDENGKAVRGRKGASTVDDCVAFLATMQGGVVASFEATRLAPGNQNRNTIEINGEKGSLRFDFERMNELQWWDHTIEPALRGWSRVLCTTPGAHPYVDAYWPPAHLIGYEHTFTNQAADIIRVIGGAKPIVPLPDFADALRTQIVLDAAVKAARQGKRIVLK